MQDYEIDAAKIETLDAIYEWLKKSNECLFCDEFDRSGHHDSECLRIQIDSVMSL